MTPTEQDKELLENIADIFDELCEPTNKFWHRDSGLHWAGKVMQLITADRKRVELEARIAALDTIHKRLAASALNTKHYKIISRMLTESKEGYREAMKQEEV